MVTSNVNSEKSECITLTYTVSNIGKISDVQKLNEELDALHDEDSVCDYEVRNFGSPDQEIKLKHKIKTCDSEANGHDIKEKLDQFIKKRGGQTTLDES